MAATCSASDVLNMLHSSPCSVLRRWPRTHNSRTLLAPQISSAACRMSSSRDSSEHRHFNEERRSHREGHARTDGESTLNMGATSRDTRAAPAPTCNVGSRQSMTPAAAPHAFTVQSEALDVARVARTALAEHGHEVCRSVVGEALEPALS